MGGLGFSPLGLISFGSMETCPQGASLKVDGVRLNDLGLAMAIAGFSSAYGPAFYLPFSGSAEWSCITLIALCCAVSLFGLVLMTKGERQTV